jgi:hypothetical protein
MVMDMRAALLGFLPQGFQEVAATVLGLFAIQQGLRALIRPDLASKVSAPSTRRALTIPIFRSRPTPTSPLGAEPVLTRQQRPSTLSVRLVGAVTCLFGCGVIAFGFLSNACPRCSGGRWGGTGGVIALAMWLGWFTFIFVLGVRGGRSASRRRRST